jgi:hypothetical protein
LRAGRPISTLSDGYFACNNIILKFISYQKRSGGKPAPKRKKKSTREQLHNENPFKRDGRRKERVKETEKKTQKIRKNNKLFGNENDDDDDGDPRPRTTSLMLLFLLLSCIIFFIVTKLIALENVIMPLD